ncbi:hypothetical protein MES5069_900019 [Mesorhizobium escarrei]|uniref:Uncharacterized protein n=1 Tax=Mesorhizobium escarrei TaxID=666018 RepID=A0ABM9EJP9_9HYPH|nr:hypothetical protein MES5069_900019 [Mesorhizobium escarrei]
MLPMACDAIEHWDPPNEGVRRGEAMSPAMGHASCTAHFSADHNDLSSAGAAANAGNSESDATSYFVDALFRSTDPSELAAPGAEGDAAAAAQASRILTTSAASAGLHFPPRSLVIVQCSNDIAARALHRLPSAGRIAASPTIDRHGRDRRAHHRPAGGQGPSERTDRRGIRRD